MKKIVLLVVLIVSMIGVQAQDSKKMTRKEKRAAREAKKIEKTKSLVDSKDYVFDATQALANRGTVNLDGSFDVKVEGDEVICYMPFYGRAYSAGYGSSEGPFDFTQKIKDYKVEKDKKGGYVITFSVDNKNDNINFTFHIGNTGSASLVLTSTNRESISYYGDITEDEDKDE